MRDNPVHEPGLLITRVGGERTGFALLHAGDHVFARDDSAGAGRRHALQRDAEVAGKLAYRRLRQNVRARGGGNRNQRHLGARKRLPAHCRCRLSCRCWLSCGCRLSWRRWLNGSWSWSWSWVGRVRGGSATTRPRASRRGRVGCSVPHQHTAAGRLGVSCAVVGRGGLPVRIDVDHHDGSSDVHRLALIHQEFGDNAVPRGGQLHQRFGGLDLNDDLVHGHGVANRNMPGDDVRLGQTFTNIGERKALKVRHRESFRQIRRSVRGRRRRAPGPRTAGIRFRRRRPGRGCGSRRREAPAPQGNGSSAR